MMQHDDFGTLEQGSLKGGPTIMVWCEIRKKEKKEKAALTKNKPKVPLNVSVPNHIQMWTILMA